MAETAVPANPGDVQLAQQIDEHRRRYELTEAEAAAAQAAERFPGSAEVAVAMGRVLLATHRRQEAAETFMQASQLAPDDGRPAAWRVAALSRLRLFDEAIDAGTAAAARFPDCPLIRVALGRVFLDSSRPEQALEHFTAAATVAPHDATAINWHAAGLAAVYRREEAQAAVRKALEEHPAEPKILSWMGTSLFNDGAFAKSGECFDAVLAIAPAHGLALVMRIAVLRELRRFDEAEDAAESAIRRLPRYPGLYVAHAWVASDQDQENEAVTRVERALAIDPRDSWALRSRTTFLRWGHRYDEAERAAVEAIERCPDDPDMHTAAAWVAVSQAHYAEADTRVDRALAIDPRNSWALGCRVDFLRMSRRYGEAEQAASEAMKLRPDSPFVATVAAQVAQDLNHYDEAVTLTERVLAIDPRNYLALRNRIAFLRSARRFTEAEQAALEAAELRPDDTDMHAAAAQVAGDQEHYDEAVSRIERVLAIDPGNSVALRSRMDFLRLARRFNEAELAARETIERLPGEPLAHMAAAWVSSDQGHYEEALTRADRALAIDPGSSYVRRSRLYFLRVARRYADAEEEARVAIELHPDDPDLHTSAAWIVSDQDDEDEAVTRVERALAIDPRDAWALRSRIEFLRYARRYSEAEQAAREATELHPDDSDVHTSAAWAASDLDRYDEAIARVDRALAIDPRNSWALRSRMDYLHYARRFGEAEEAARQAIERRPSDPDVHTAAGWLASYQDRDDEAVTCANQALAIEPGNAYALRSRVTFLRSARRLDEAEQAAREATGLHPGDLDMRVELGRIHDDRREFEAALGCLDVVLARYPDHVGASVARSAVLRSLRRGREARRGITRLSKLKPKVRDLQFELGWIDHDERQLPEARKAFRKLLGTADGAAERAEAHHGLGWVAFTGTDFTTAEQEFRAAVKEQPGNLDYELALAWSLARQSGRARWEEAEGIAASVLERRPDPSAHLCLGVLAFKRGGFASSEYHLTRALEIDPWRGSHTDLGALYSHIGRYDDAESELLKAVARDWYDTAAHVELGRLFLQLGEPRLPDAEREFRQAMACDPMSGAAAIGLAQALEKSGDEAAAETILRQALRRQEPGDAWRAHLALARLLVQRGDKQQNPDLLAEAYAQAQQAIGLAPDAEADPHFVAGVALHRLGSLSVDARGRLGYRRRARNHLRECVKRDEGNADAQRSLLLLEREMKVTAPTVWGGYAVAAVSFALLTTMWVTFFLTDKVTTVLLSVTTPVLVGLFTIATLLPALIRLRLPGFEADLQAGTEVTTNGPTGDVTFSPGRFSAPGGPTGQLTPRSK